MTDFPLWSQARQHRTLLSVELDLTARCNNDCPHCYICLPADDHPAKSRELSLDRIKAIADEAVSLGTLWFLLTGGEPLLREDFADIYVYLKKKGILVSLFTNASLVTPDHIDLFRKYPPRDIEVTVYGVTPRVHRRATRSDNFASTMAGIDMLVSAGLPVTLKTTLMKANVEEAEAISVYCRARTRSPFRFDPFLHLRLDRDPVRNRRILSERLPVEKILELERKDPARFGAVAEICREIGTLPCPENPSRLFRCSAGVSFCAIDHAGRFKLCSALCNERCVYDLGKGSLSKAWNDFAPEVMNMESDSPAYAEACGSCNLLDICSWCPAHGDLETGGLDNRAEHFCTVAKARHTLACPGQALERV
jgi:radical SAM protein with 4Fe4S-binding SPASM domain